LLQGASVAPAGCGSLASGDPPCHRAARVPAVPPDTATPPRTRFVVYRATAFVLLTGVEGATAEFDDDVLARSKRRGACRARSRGFLWRRV